MADNYYNILGIKPNCTKEEIKKTYRKLSLQHHPDRPNGTKAMFQKISKAYEILSDEIKKKNYDANLNVKKNTQQENNQFPNMGYFHRAFGMDINKRGKQISNMLRIRNEILRITFYILFLFIPLSLGMSRSRQSKTDM